jgi:hypothetical protein
MGKLTHVAVFTWKPGTTAAQVATLCEGLARLPALIPDITGYRLGPDAGLGTATDQFAVVADFDDEAAYRRYATDAHHLDVIERLLKPILASRHAVQFVSG